MPTKQPSFSGLSVLIPVFNYPVEKLVNSLLLQLQQTIYNFEIIILEDGSEEGFKIENRKLSQLKNVQFLELKDNIGRSAVRNLLAKKAAFSCLLFLDCDSKIESENFIQNYINHSGNVVVIGGRNYTLSVPEEKYILHWTVGKAKEVKSIQERKASPYECFMFNNIFLHKDVYLKIGLDESIKTYGHEDTKFGNLLKEKNISVLHIENPTIHEGLDETGRFLEKTIQGVNNLRILTHSGFGTQSSLYLTFKKIEKVGASGFLLKTLNPLLPLIIKNLHSKRPSLIVFDIFKLYYFIKFSKEKLF